MTVIIGNFINTGVKINGYKLSKNVIDDLIEKQPIVPITVNFNSFAIIGKTKSFHLEDKTVICEAVIADGVDLDLIIKDCYIVPEVSFDKSENNKGDYLHNVVFTSVGLTMYPAYTTLKPVKQKKEK